MAFLKLQIKNETARTINGQINEADALITRLAALRVALIDWQATLAANTADFNNADRTEFGDELTRLNGRINTEL